MRDLSRDKQQIDYEVPAAAAGPAVAPLATGHIEILTSGARPPVRQREAGTGSLLIPATTFVLGLAAGLLWHTLNATEAPARQTGRTAEDCAIYSYEGWPGVRQ